MTGQMFRLITLGWLMLGLISFMITSFIPAPYGRYSSARSKLKIRTDIGWMVMESPAVIVFAVVYIVNRYPSAVLSMVWIVTWMLHYVQRAFVYPIVSQSGLKVMPLAIVFGGFSFNCVNAYLNASFLYSYAPPYPETWWFDLRFISGMCLFAFGYVMNRHSDRILRSLRRQSPTQYGIPEGGFFQWVSCPNYLGEILIWCGWALATWALPALAFAVWTTANLAPRAGFHHRWYKSTFSDYPANRKALIPGIW